jgi:1-acyl-sn-glycerol-3-phosphate acyltransferase
VSTVFYGILWLLLNAAGKLFFRYRVVGCEHVPTQGGALIAANHASYVDIPFVGGSVRRRMWYLGRQDLFLPVFRPILQWLGWIPIRQDRLDRDGFGKAIRLIQEGKIVVIYPEGTRTPDGALRRGKPGMGIIVAETGCTVIPAYLAGTREVLPIGARWLSLHPIRITFGAPINFTEAAQRLSGKEFYQHVSRIVMGRIADLGQVAPPADPAEGQPAALSRKAE